jgi:hypothetical protein
LDEEPKGIPEQCLSKVRKWMVRFAPVAAIAGHQPRHQKQTRQATSTDARFGGKRTSKKAAARASLSKVPEQPWLPIIGRRLL